MRDISFARRRFLAYFSSAGLTSTLFPGALWGKLEAALQEEEQPKEFKITTEMIAQAEKLAGLEFTPEDRQLMLEDVNERLEGFESMRSQEFPNGLAPALRFDPALPGRTFSAEQQPIRWSLAEVSAPDSVKELAFAPLTQLAELMRRRQIQSRALTEMYLQRLERHGPALECVVTLTTERALQAADRADRELANGQYRGPLHGIPWGAKDLLATRGYRTTWGATPFQEQMLDEDATVVTRLDAAGAVLVAKLTLGALAWGDVWYGGMTRNPWNPEQGSSGSSAGSAAATAAGLVGFSIGTETLGSIVSPCTRCGVTGLRPTFGRVSRHGAMALCWSMDKIGPLCRSVEDCAMVFDAIRGPDGKDATIVDLPFNWDGGRGVSGLRIGYLREAFDRERQNEEWRSLDLQVLETLRNLGVELIPIELPSMPTDGLSVILEAEAAAAFDELTRSRKDRLLVRQERRAWPNVFRHSRFIPAVEYIQANRLRTRLMEQMEEIFERIDVYATPSFGGNNLLITNLTGHPCVVAPNGFTEQGTPTSISFVGALFGEAKLLSVAKTYQDATDFHLRRPEQFQDFEAG
jgi:Asp-tRNA(Asn)/Glu-tRNA(Gln) amidotransferase A subunit family amidase